MAWVRQFAHQVEHQVPSERPEARLFEDFPDLAYLLFESTDAFKIILGLEPNEVDEWATYIEDTGMCPDEFGNFDCMYARVGTGVRYWRERHGAL